MTAFEVAAIATSGFVAGIVNTMAGGGSLLTIPLLVMIGLPGTVANGTNRFGVLVQSAVAALRFRSAGVSGFAHAAPTLWPLLAGAALGAVGVTRLDDGTFEKLFGVVMLLVLAPALARPRIVDRASANERMSPAATALMFFVIGVYGGAFQAGVGIFMVLALVRSGHDLVMANSVKTVAVAAFTAISVAIFVIEDKIVWAPALLLAAATSAGAVVGARWTVRGGERAVRPVLAAAVLALAGRMLGLY